MLLEGRWELVILLSGVIFLPAVVALGLLLTPKRWTKAIKTISLLAALAVLAATVYLGFLLRELYPFGRIHSVGDGTMPLVVRLAWIPAFHVEYFLGVDGISLPLVLLTSLLSVLAMLASWTIQRHEKAYCVLFLLLETGLLGVFLALDFFLFYVFWEVTLLPMYFLIGLWGGPRREYAAVKFFLFTLAGSVLMLVAMLMLYFSSDLRSLSPSERLACHAWAGLEDDVRPIPSGAEEVIPSASQGRSALESFGLEIGGRSGLVERPDQPQDQDFSSIVQAPYHTFNLLALAALGQSRNLKKASVSFPPEEAYGFPPEGTSGKENAPAADGGTPGIGPLDRPLLWGKSIQWWAFLLLLAGFLVKVPSVPVHTWLPDAHVEAPTPISMLLAGVLLKMGGYGLLRIAYPICPAGGYELAWLVCGLGLVSMIYGAFAALAQKDFKRLVAYSSVSHMGYVVLGLGVWSAAAAHAYRIDAWLMGASGAVFQMIAHGVTSAGMFFLVGVIYDRVHHRDLDKMGGLLHRMPTFGALSIVIFFGAMGLPGLCGFVGEVLVLLGAWHYSAWMAAVGASVVILTAGYILWTIQRVYMGAEYRGPHPEALQPMSRRELSVALPLAVLTVALGLYPHAVFSYVEPSVRQTIQHLADWTRRREAAPPPAPANRSSGTMSILPMYFSSFPVVEDKVREKSAVKTKPLPYGRGSVGSPLYVGGIPGRHCWLVQQCWDRLEPAPSGYGENRPPCMLEGRLPRRPEPSRDRKGAAIGPGGTCPFRLWREPSPSPGLAFGQAGLSRGGERQFLEAAIFQSPVVSK